MSNGNEISDARRERLAQLAARPEEAIDTSDIPEAPAETWDAAEIGRFYRPKKEVVTIRLDADILAYFRREAHGTRGYQTAINAALREHVARKL
jgi:uncharacterized protein (DUF4415 family)